MKEKEDSKFSEIFFYSIIIMAIVVLLGVGVYAVIPNPGHSLSEVEGAEDLAWGVPSSLKLTTNKHDGDFGGYESMNIWIQQNGCSGYHVCDSSEITKFLQSGGEGYIQSFGNAWYNTGIYDYKENSELNYDCESWNTTNVAHFGDIAQVSSSGTLTYSESSCSSENYVLCCKY